MFLFFLFLSWFKYFGGTTSFITFSSCSLDCEAVFTQKSITKESRRTVWCTKVYYKNNPLLSQWTSSIYTWAREVPFDDLKTTNLQCSKIVKDIWHRVCSSSKISRNDVGRVFFFTNEFLEIPRQVLLVRVKFSQNQSACSNFQKIFTLAALMPLKRITLWECKSIILEKEGMWHWRLYQPMKNSHFHSNKLKVAPDILLGCVKRVKKKCYHK